MVVELEIQSQPVTGEQTLVVEAVGGGKLLQAMVAMAVQES